MGAKIYLMKRSTNRFLVNKSKYDSIAPRFEANYQQKHKWQVAKRKCWLRGVNRRHDNISHWFAIWRQNSLLKRMNILIDNTETNHSINLIAKIQSKSPQSNYERFARQFVNLVDMAKKNKSQHIIKSSFRWQVPMDKFPNAKSRDPRGNGTSTPESSNPATPSDIYANAYNFVLIKIFTKHLLAFGCNPERSPRLCVGRNEEDCKQLSRYTHTVSDWTYTWSRPESALMISSPLLNRSKMPTLRQVIQYIPVVGDLFTSLTRFLLYPNFFFDLNKLFFFLRFQANKKKILTFYNFWQ